MPSSWRKLPKATRLRIGENITDARDRAKLSRAQLGERVGVAYQTVLCWEIGYRTPAVTTLFYLAHALGVTTHQLLPATMAKKDA